MVILFDIIFQSGEFFNQSDGNFFWKMLPSILGSLIGFGGSLYLYYRKSRDDKEKDDAKEIAEKKKINDEKSAQEIDQLNYFTLLTESVISITEKQVGHFREFAQNARSSPYEFKILQLQVNRDLFRIEEKLDQKIIFIAFTNKYGNSIESIKRFNQIISSLDFIYVSMTEIQKALEKAQKNILELYLKFKELEESISSYMADTSNRLKHSLDKPEENDFYNFLDSALLKYFDKEKRPAKLTIPYAHENLIDPVKNEIIRNFRNWEEAMKIVADCTRATLIYTEIKENVEYMADYFERHANKIEKANNDLKLEAKELLVNINATAKTERSSSIEK